MSYQQQQQQQDDLSKYSPLVTELTPMGPNGPAPNYHTSVSPPLPPAGNMAYTSNTPTNRSEPLSDSSPGDAKGNYHDEHVAEFLNVSTCI